MISFGASSAQATLVDFVDEKGRVKPYFVKQIRRLLRGMGLEKKLPPYTEKITKLAPPYKDIKANIRENKYESSCTNRLETWDLKSLYEFLLNVEKLDSQELNIQKKFPLIAHDFMENVYGADSKFKLDLDKDDPSWNYIKNGIVVDVSDLEEWPCLIDQVKSITDQIGPVALFLFGRNNSTVFKLGALHHRRDTELGKLYESYEVPYNNTSNDNLRLKPLGVHFKNILEAVSKKEGWDKNIQIHFPEEFPEEEIVHYTLTNGGEKDNILEFNRNVGLNNLGRLIEDLYLNDAQYGEKGPLRIHEDTKSKDPLGLGYLGTPYTTFSTRTLALKTFDQEKEVPNFVHETKIELHNLQTKPRNPMKIYLEDPNDEAFYWIEKLKSTCRDYLVKSGHIPPYCIEIVKAPNDLDSIINREQMLEDQKKNREERDKEAELKRISLDQDKKEEPAAGIDKKEEPAAGIDKKEEPEVIELFLDEPQENLQEKIQRLTAELKRNFLPTEKDEPQVKKEEDEMKREELTAGIEKIPLEPTKEEISEPSEEETAPSFYILEPPEEEKA